MSANGKQTKGSEDRVDDQADREHQTYLRVAETVLTTALSPLKAREIVDRGIDRGLFGDHVLSRTPEKSMQARLSMDILKRKAQSKFVRVGRGRFTLREALEGGHGAAGDISSIQEYVAHRRVLRTPKEEVLCTPEQEFGEILTFQGIDTDTIEILEHLIDRSPTIYVPRSEAETRDDAKQFITYVLVQCGQRLLYFKRSYLSRAAEFLRGSKCIGFGGHVSAADADMLSISDKGLASCARRELAEELHLADEKVATSLPKSPSRKTVRLFDDSPLERLGVLNDDSSEVGRRHVAVIYRTWLSDWDVAKRLQKGDSSIKGLGWIDLSRDRVNISEFEYWSQLCLRKFYPSTVVGKPGFKIANAARLTNDRIIVVAGRIGSGKSETANYLSQKLNCPLIKTGILVQQLMGSPSLAEIGRKEFQARALDYIQSDGRPAQLADAIAAQISESASRCVVDGIRHLSVYENLDMRVQGNAGLVYVQTPPDIAYEMYRSREAQSTLSFSYREFLEIYDAPVEAEIPSLGRKADAYIYNSFGMESFRRTLDDLAGSLQGNTNESARGLGKARARYRDDAA